MHATCPFVSGLAALALANAATAQTLVGVEITGSSPPIVHPFARPSDPLACNGSPPRYGLDHGGLVGLHNYLFDAHDKFELLLDPSSDLAGSGQTDLGGGASRCGAHPGCVRLALIARVRRVSDIQLGQSGVGPQHLLRAALGNYATGQKPAAGRRLVSGTEDEFG